VENKVGDVVTIYRDPLLKHRPEGKARLVEKLSSSEPRFEYWKVQFLGETITCFRVVEKKRGK